jgi:hypothetical protein
MAQRRNGILLASIMVLSGICSSAKADCKPRIGVVTPDFIVLASPPSGSPFRVIIRGTCLTGAHFAMTPEPTPTLASSSAPVLSPAPSPIPTPQITVSSPDANKVTADIGAPPGRFTICANQNADQNCIWGGGPIIQVLSAGICGPVDPGGTAISSLESEQFPEEGTTPLVAECDLDKAGPPADSIDKAIIVDGATGYTCIAADKREPNVCSTDVPRKKQKKPLSLQSGDIVLVYVKNKNPFRETYKFSSTDQQIKDDDIGSFLALLVPSLGGGGSSKSDKGSGGSAPKADASTLNSLRSSLSDATASLNSVQSLKAGGHIAEADQELHSLNEKLGAPEAELKNEAEKQELAMAFLPPDTRETVAADVEAADPAIQTSEKNRDKLPQPSAKPHPPKTLENEYRLTQERVEKLKTANSELLDAVAVINEQIDRTNAIRACSNSVQQRVDNLVFNYHFFAAAYNEVRNQLVSGKVKGPDSCKALRENATALWELANAENEKLLSTQINFNLRDVAALIDQEKAKTAKPSDNGSAKAPAGNGSATPGTATRARHSSTDSGLSTEAGTKKEDPKANEQDRQYALALDAQANSLKGSICILKALHTEVSPVLPDSMATVESVFVNPNAFVSTYQIGPYADPTQVDWTLTKTIIKPVVAGISVAKFNSDIDDCISNSSAKPADSTDSTKKKDSGSAGLYGTIPFHHPSYRPAALNHLELRNASFSPAATPFFDPFVEPTPQKSDPKNSGAKKDSSGAKSGDSSGDNSNPQQNPSGSDDSSTTTRGKRINFGAERFIVSIGLTGAALGQNEFGKAIGQPLFDASGNPVTSPQPLTTIVIQKNNSTYRLSPMAFLNTRIYQRAEWINATYATFGITAKSDAPGVRPEYMLGLSQSFFERHMLLTLGFYAGQQSSLAGGLKVNQAVPTSLTGDLAINSPYRFRFGAALSWRVPGLSK